MGDVSAMLSSTLDKNALHLKKMYIGSHKVSAQINSVNMHNIKLFLFN